MSDLVDLRALLQSWPYDADNDARLVPGQDGREIIQVRTPLGVEQYEIDGRPDGLRPHGLDSVLDFHRRQLAVAKSKGCEANFQLDASDCADLFAEGVLFYYRYLRLFQLKDWARTIRDTARNLKLFDFVHRYAEMEEDQMALEKWRPYIVRMNGAASALLALQKGSHDKAEELVQRTIDRIQSIDEMDDETFRFERQRSLTALREMLDGIQENRPMTDLKKLERQLKQAIEMQEFERAASLRDQIRSLRETGRKAGG